MNEFTFEWKTIGEVEVLSLMGKAGDILFSTTPQQAEVLCFLLEAALRERETAIKLEAAATMNRVEELLKELKARSE